MFLLSIIDIGVGLFRFLDDLDNAPFLIFGNRSGFHDHDSITNSAFVLLVVSFELYGSFDNLFIKGVFYIVLDRYDNRFIHFVADNFADPRFSEVPFHSLNPPVVDCTFFISN